MKKYKLGAYYSDSLDDIVILGKKGYDDWVNYWEYGKDHWLGTAGVITVKGDKIKKKKWLTKHKYIYIGKSY